MRTLYIIGVVMLVVGPAINGVRAQNDQLPDILQSRLEGQAARTDAQPVDESNEEYLERCRQHPLNLNRVEPADLQALELLDPLQVDDFFAYRKAFGMLISIYELQAVPGWDLETIRILRPFVDVRRDESLKSAFRERWRGGDQLVLIKAGETLEQSKGYKAPSQPGGQYYEGSPLNLSLRYGYNYKNLFQFGFRGEKDAGESFFSGAEKRGFDFYSFYIYLRRAGVIQTLALGDFTVNFGQGLTQWQSAAYTKSSSVLFIKREAEIIRPYHSSGEVNFHRGAAITLKRKNRLLTVFASGRKISSSAFTDTSGADDFSSFQASGYHRTPSEIASRNNVRQWAGGADLTVSNKRLSISLHAIHFSFSRSFQASDALYHHFAFSGRSLSNVGLSYNYSIRNMHLFGELASDARGHPALIAGGLASLCRNVDFSILYRRMDRAYQSIYTDAFTESTSPVNEQGLYAGIAWTLMPALRLDGFYDVFVFPWLKYRIDAPSRGRDYFLQLTYQPTKQWRICLRYKNEQKQINGNEAGNAEPVLTTPVKKDCRVESDYQCNRQFSLSSRIEMLWLNTGNGQSASGFLGLTTLFFRGRGFGANLGGLYFETTNYDTRVYTYESDMLYNFSLPAYYGRGYHYFLNLHKSLLTKHSAKVKMTVWLRWAQTFYPGLTAIGTGLDEISGNRKSMLRLQWMMNWK